MNYTSDWASHDGLILVSGFVRGGRDVYHLNPKNFISGGGFCWQGMILTVFVQELTPVPAEAKTPSSESSSLSAALLCVFAIAHNVIFFSIQIIQRKAKPRCSDYFFR
ncbi:hypothetical protein MKX01_014521 [Papaver californicum]|nr:hypothetical protein MKX01_014521 [Papaver californicum]